MSYRGPVFAVLLGLVLLGVDVGAAQITGTLGTSPSNATSRALDQLNQSVMRPVPSLPPAPVVRPATVWVPDQYIRVPGVASDVHVPAHWEHRLPSGQLYSPPLVGTTPEGQAVPLPPGSYPSTRPSLFAD
jgi:hypothetical protein